MGEGSEGSEGKGGLEARVGVGRSRGGGIERAGDDEKEGEEVKGGKVGIGSGWVVKSREEMEGWTGEEGAGGLRREGEVEFEVSMVEREG